MSVDAAKCPEHRLEKCTEFTSTINAKIAQMTKPFKKISMINFDDVIDYLH